MEFTINLNAIVFLPQIPQEETKESTSDAGFNVIVKEAGAALAEIIEMVSRQFYTLKCFFVFHVSQDFYKSKKIYNFRFPFVYFNPEIDSINK